MDARKLAEQVSEPAFLHALLGDSLEPFSVGIGQGVNGRVTVVLHIRSAQGLALPEGVHVGGELVPLEVREGYAQARPL
jgi:hypothetical protein